MNPIQMLQALVKGGKNPEQIVMQMIGGNNNPMLNNLIEMGRSGNTKSIENFARNLCKEKGINFDTEFNSFMSNFR